MSSLTAELERLPQTARDKVNEVFIEATLARELGGDWKLVVRRAVNTSIGVRHRIFKTMLSATEEEMLTITKYLSGELK